MPFPVDDNFTDHPKLEQFAREPAVWAKAVALWVAANCYARRMQRERPDRPALHGFVPTTALARMVPFRDAEAIARRLTEKPAGFESGLFVVAEGGFRIHDFDAYGDPPADELAVESGQTLSEKRRAAGRAGAARRWQPHSKPPDLPFESDSKIDGKPDSKTGFATVLSSVGGGLGGGSPSSPSNSEIKETNARARDGKTDSKRDGKTALPLVPMADALDLFSECRKRNGLGIAPVHSKNYREAESLCEQLQVLAADRNEPWQETLEEILTNFERDDFARSARLALGVLVKDLGKWLGAPVASSPEAYDAARSALVPQIDALENQIRRLKSSREGEHAGDEIAELEAKRDGLAAELAAANPSLAVAARRRRVG